MVKLALLAFLTAAVTVSAVPAPVSPCAQVHIIVARASGEDPGPGIIGELAQNVQSKSKQSVSTNSINYPATLTDYANSSAQGTVAMIAALKAQADACPSQKIVLIGYSQGAHVIGDTLAGGGGGISLGPLTPAISTTYQNRVTAVVQMGDPRFEPFKSYDAGTAITGGLFSRPSSQVFSSTIQGRLKSYCDYNDLFCASGLSTLVHLTYLSRYLTSATNFILEKIGN